MANRLQYETSPYLLQHAHNPVDWYPWGDEAFAKAQEENKPVLVSIGYSACHWCHVMERESFENEAVAAFMNRHFVNIKVDREEHPDVDHLYMDALQAVSGSGGWPLNMFVTPDRKPFYGGTYFPPDKMYNRASWMDILEAIKKTWDEKREEVELQSHQLLQHLQQSSLVASDDGRILSPEMATGIATQLLKQADRDYGGFGQAPKFPASMTIVYLLQHYHYTGNEQSLEHALFSLDAMIKGGIYDQLGGGFARYATDNQWLVPHFEKMLYDNALLITAMCHAYRITGKDLYRKTIEATIAFCNRELSDGKGFYCALDADSEGVEGKYYTWTWEEWLQVFPGGDPALEAYFGITSAGNWEHTNILSVAVDESYILEQYGLQETGWQERLHNAIERLQVARKDKIRPATDDKLLLSWNALMNKALTDAALALTSDQYLQQALDHAEWMLATFYTTDKSLLLHVAKGTTARIQAKLDDYAYFIQSLFALASASGINKYIYIANELTDQAIRDFSDEKGQFFFFSSQKQQDIPVRKVEIYDGAIPSANSIMAEILYLSGILRENMQLVSRSEQMLQDMAQTVVRYPTSFPNWAGFLQRYVNGIRELVIASSDAKNILKDWQGHYNPGIYTFLITNEQEHIPAFAGKFKPQSTNLYLCRQFSCQRPVADLKALLEVINF